MKKIGKIMVTLTVILSIASTISCENSNDTSQGDYENIEDILPSKAIYVDQDKDSYNNEDIVNVGIWVYCEDEEEYNSIGNIIIDFLKDTNLYFYNSNSSNENRITMTNTSFLSQKKKHLTGARLLIKYDSALDGNETKFKIKTTDKDGNEIVSGEYTFVMTQEYRSAIPGDVWYYFFGSGDEDFEYGGEQKDL